MKIMVNRKLLATKILPVSRVVMCLSLEREVCSSNLVLVKSDIVLQMASHRCGISFEEAVLP